MSKPDGFMSLPTLHYIPFVTYKKLSLAVVLCATIDNFFQVDYNHTLTYFPLESFSQDAVLHCIIFHVWHYRRMGSYFICQENLQRCQDRLKDILRKETHFF